MVMFFDVGSILDERLNGSAISMNYIPGVVVVVVFVVVSVVIVVVIVCAHPCCRCCCRCLLELLSS